MTAQILLLVIAGVPFLLALLFRVNSVFVFLSIAVGSLLQQTLGESAGLALSPLIKNGPVDVIANLGLLGLPLVMTLVFARKTMLHGNVFLQIVPLIGACIAGAALAMQLLTPGLRGAIETGPFGAQITSAADLVIAIAAVLNLMLAWRIYRFHEEHKHSKR